MFEEIKKAAGVIGGVVQRTPIIYSSSFSELLGFGCYLKLENLQKTGSFKVRGAYNKLSSLTDDERAAGVVAASSGNHAQGVAWAATLLGIESTIVMPETAPIIKQVAARSYGARVIFHGSTFGEAYERALGLAADKGFTFIPPFDDELVIAGQGTVGLEIAEELPEADLVVVQVGGGGLISGVAAAVKERIKGVRVVGVEAEASPSCTESLKAGRSVPIESRPTIADGIAVKEIGQKTFPLIKEYVDGVVLVGEEAIAGAIVKFLERKKLVVEGAGAVPLAAAIDGKIEGKIDGPIKKAVFVVSGGNIDVTTLDRIIHLGLIKEGRVATLSAVIPDVPGSLAGLIAGIASQKANILNISHIREAPGVPVGRVRVEVIIEVEGPEHSERVLKALREKGYKG
jgi:threonine dehydratase